MSCQNIRVHGLEVLSTLKARDGVPELVREIIADCEKLSMLLEAYVKEVQTPLKFVRPVHVLWVGRYTWKADDVRGNDDHFLLQPVYALHKSSRGHWSTRIQYPTANTPSDWILFRGIDDLMGPSYQCGLCRLLPGTATMETYYGAQSSVAFWGNAYEYLKSLGMECLVSSKGFSEQRRTWPLYSTRFWIGLTTLISCSGLIAWNICIGYLSRKRRRLTGWGHTG